MISFIRDHPSQNLTKIHLQLSKQHSLEKDKHGENTTITIVPGEPRVVGSPTNSIKTVKEIEGTDAYQWFDLIRSSSTTDILEVST